ncbi:hypothetical protein NL676_010188 [Syzygium grande]|nr:hypothetical protein NL676_010188 [Syzygium grande]
MVGKREGQNERGVCLRLQFHATPGVTVLVKLRWRFKTLAGKITESPASSCVNEVLCPENPRRFLIIDWWKKLKI